MTVSNICEPSIATQLRIIEGELKARGIELLIGSHYFDADEEQRIVDSFMRFSVDGIVAISGFDDTEELYVAARKTIPVVFISRIPISDDMPFTATDHRVTACQVYDYLYGRGHREIGLLTVGHSNLHGLRRQVQGHLLARSVRGADLRSDSVVHCPELFMHEIPHAILNAGSLAQIVLDRGFTGLQVASDYIAIAMLKAFAHAGVRVPQDLSVIGHGNIEYGMITTPQLTSVESNLVGICQGGITYLLDAIEIPDTTPVRHYTDGSIVERESVMSIR